MKVKDVMHHVTKLQFNTTVADTAIVMDHKIIGSVLVEENNKVIGMVTERDILRKVVAKRKDPEKVIIKDIMNAPLITADSDISIEEASSIIANNKIRRLIITEKDKIVGIVTASTIAKNIGLITVKKILEMSSSEHFRPDYDKPTHKY